MHFRGANRLVVVAVGTIFMLWFLWPLDDNSPKPPVLQTSAQGHDPVPVPTEQTYLPHEPTSTNTFTIVMLSYKSPKSLSKTITSLFSSGIAFHPLLSEIVVYFQVRTPADDVIVKDLSSTLGSNVSIRSMGSSDNLPVALAMRAAIRSAETPLVLYLECDRPVVALAAGTEATRALAAAHIDAATTLLSENTTDIFRLQLYASHHLLNREGEEPPNQLPVETYGRSPHSTCLQTPAFHKVGGVCTNHKAAKQRFGNVFSTAYCKHWKKLHRSESSPQADMCDAFCFLDWATNNTLRPQKITNRAVQTTRVGDLSVACLTSEDCNWTNQPTMFRKDWYLKQIMAACETSKGFCIGPPGRQSAVRKELFFVKHPEWWAQRRFRICLGPGLFVHDEVDNRE